ncbi:MAG: cysteine--tRNA ligase [Deltaproteobacteria bacterium]|nr:cysteine--tRNA ligase [Deltaproteobacteria bacterium]
MTAVSVKPLKLLNTRSQKKEVFKGHYENKVSIYCCGPTVYGYTHVGNARAALTLDLVSRIFKLAHYQIEAARNYTDIDDKIIEASKRENKTSHEIAEFYQKAYDEELSLLKALTPKFRPKATESVEDIVEFIQSLEKKQMAYSVQTEFGTDVYFRVSKFKKYGALSKRKLDDMIAGSRIDIDEKKEHPADFALWKAAKPEEPSWKSPWGNGRPGWHIECSAMIYKIFKSDLDIHMGGLDLIFPHHENEIAQSESLTEKALATYWLHNGMIEVGKEKMSKSIGNILRTADFIRDYGAETLRLLVFQQHYRSPMDLSEESILRAEALIDKLYLAKLTAKTIKPTADSAVTPLETKLPSELESLSAKIEESLLDDFNSAKALGQILSALRASHRENTASCWQVWAQSLPFLNSVFGILEEDPAQALKHSRERRLKRMQITETQAAEIDQKLIERENLRKQKNFEASDQIRKDLEKEGIQIMDGPDGSAWAVSKEK